MAKTSSNIIKFITPITILGLLFLANKIQLPGNTYLWREIQNTAHTPFFGILSILFLSMSIQYLGTLINKRLWHYLVAFSICLLIGVISEYIQIAGPRDADLWDIARDISGAVSFLGFLALSDKKLVSGRGKRRVRIKLVIFMCSSIILLLALAPLALLKGAYIYRDRAFPQICGFESFWEDKFIKTKNAELLKTPPPCQWIKNDSDGAAKLTFFPAGYARFSIEEPYPDWMDYKFLSFDAFSELDTSIAMTIRIEDFQHDGSYQDRFNHSFVIEPGLNRIDISLEHVRTAPSGRDMDMAAIWAIRLFSTRPERAFTLYFDDFRLK